MTALPRPPRAPKGLSGEARRLFRAVVDEFELETHALAILGVALEAFDRMREAQAAVAADGAYIEGRFGMKAHPGLAVERDSRLQFLRGVRELGLDLDPDPRPPTRWRGR
jgi:phage terminase small subunit